MLKKQLQILLIINIFQTLKPELYFTDHKKSLKKTSWAENTLKKLTLDQKIGQLFIIAAISSTEQPTETLATELIACPYNLNKKHIKQAVKEDNVGGIIFLFKSTPEYQQKLTKKYQALSKLPLFIAQDSEWGLAMRLDLLPNKVIRYPKNMTLGAIKNTNLIYKLGKEIGKQCLHLGVHINFAPVVDINNNPNNSVIHDRSFSDDKNKVAKLANSYAKGLQDVGIIACAKHFPGHGDTNIDSHLELPRLKHQKKRLENLEIYPFRYLIKNNISAIMIGHLLVEALDKNNSASLSYNIVTNYLQKKLNFKGLIITDGLGMKAITKNLAAGQIALQAFMAGNDILLCPTDLKAAQKAIKESILSGIITVKELDQKVFKILKAKEWALKKETKYTKNNDFLIRDKAIKLQEELFDNAITIVNNKNKIKFNQKLIENSSAILIGKLPENIFKNYLNQTACKVIEQNQVINLQEIYNFIKNYNNKTIIIAIGQINKIAAERFGIDENIFKLLDMLKEEAKEIILIIFGTPYSLKYFKDTSLLIAAYEDDPAMQKSAFKLIAGQIIAKGELPVKINLNQINIGS